MRLKYLLTFFIHKLLRNAGEHLFDYIIDVFNKIDTASTGAEVAVLLLII